MKKNLTQTKNNKNIAEVLDEILVKLCIEKGLEDVKNGNTITTEQLKKELQIGN